MMMLRRILAGLCLALLLAVPAEAQMGRRLLILGGAAKVNPRFHRSFTTRELAAVTGSFDFPFRERPVDPLRTQLVIRNVGSTVIDLGPQPDNGNYTGPTSFTVTLNPGQEYADNGASTSAWFARPHTRGQGATYTIYHELSGSHQSGTAVTENLTAPAVGIPALNIFSYATATAYPIGLSQDRKTVYGTAGTPTLYQSTSDGASWGIVNSTSFGVCGNVVGLVETDDGEAIVGVQNGSSSPGCLFKSTGWTASHTGATWANVLTSATKGYFQNLWDGTTFASFGRNSINGTGKYGVTGEYGQLLTTGTDPTFPTKVYFTSNYGATWSTVLDIQTNPPAQYPMHMKAAAYDLYWDRLWATFDLYQDNVHAAILYSDDHGSTWTLLTMPTEFQGSGPNQNWQSNAIAPMASAIIFNSDHNNGYYRIPRVGYRKMGTLEVSAITAPPTGASQTSEGSFRSAPGQRLFTGLISNTSGVVPGLIYTDDATDGQEMTELWRDDAYLNTIGGSLNLIGPTFNGYFISDIANGSGTHFTLRGKVADGVQGQYPQYVTVTGDGATTVFNFAHFISSTPTRLNIYPQNAAAVGAALPTLTANGTNLILTFAAAPANLSVQTYAVRYGPGSNPPLAPASSAYNAEAEDNTSQTTYTLSNVSIGSPTVNRNIVLGVCVRTASTFATPTVTLDPGDGGGARTATKVVDQFTGAGSPITYSGVYQVPGLVAAGTLATVTIGGFGPAAARAAVQSYSVVTTQQSAPSGSAISSGTLAGSTASASITVPASGEAIAAFCGATLASGSFTAPASGFTQDYSALIGGSSTTVTASGHDNAAQSGSRTYTFTANTSTSTSAEAVAAWGP